VVAGTAAIGYVPCNALVHAGRGAPRTTPRHATQETLMTWTRRGFIAAAATGLAAGALPRRLLAAASRNSFTELRRNVGIFTARGGTIGWLANSAGALVVDSQYPDTARDFLTGFATRGASRIDVLVNTHHHADHTGGNAVVRPAARAIVAHERAVALQRRVAGASTPPAEPTVADTTFADAWSARIGDETVRARHYGAAHTGGDCTVHFEQADVVHMGDLVFNRAYPFIDRAGGASIVGWIALLEAVAAAHGQDTIYVFGHARPGHEITGRRADVLLQRDFLAAVLDVARRAAAAGRSRDETMRVTLPGFDEHDALAPQLSLAAVLGVAWDEVAGM
jgi:cyclase